MAQRRMFSPDIVCSEEFLEMPPSSRELYFQLGMRADDDGFIQPNGVMRTLGSSTDDLKVLVAKRFLLPFETGVVVIKHWLIHNMIRADRYKETRFLEEKKTLYLKDNKAYTDRLPSGCQNDNQPAPQVRLGKDRILADETSAPIERIKLPEEGSPKEERRTKDKEAIYLLFSSKEQPWWRHAHQKKAALSLFDLVGHEKVRQGVSIMKEHSDDNYCPQAATPFEYEEKLPALSRFVKRNGL